MNPRAILLLAYVGALVAIAVTLHAQPHEHDDVCSGACGDALDELARTNRRLTNELSRISPETLRNRGVL